MIFIIVIIILIACSISIWATQMNEEEDHTLKK